jgi:hypothetical protein
MIEASRSNRRSAVHMRIDRALEKPVDAGLDCLIGCHAKGPPLKAVVARRFIVRKDGTLFCRFVAIKFIVVNAAFGRAQHFQCFRAAKCIGGATLL